MTAVLKVLAPGLCTLVVDHGRPSSRSLGVPLGGAADRASLALGNALVGNPPDAAALEISLSGPTLEATGPLACVLFGAPFELSSPRQRLAPGKTFTLETGEVLTIGGTRGCRAYLCVHGGLHNPVVLGSRSSLEPLRAEDRIPCTAGSIGAHFIVDAVPWWEEEVVSLHVLPGSHADWFAGEGLYGPLFQISRDSNRMGVRLQGEPIPVSSRGKHAGELLSEPACPGTMQVTRDGQCVILGVDGQTIGGYPRIAQVSSADLDRLGQLHSRQSVRFQQVTLEEAEQLYREAQTQLRQRLVQIRTAVHSGLGVASRGP